MVKALELKDKYAGAEVTEIDNWKPPSPSMHKINVDAFLASQNKRGLVAVIRDSCGTILTAACSMETEVWDPKISEATATCFGLQVTAFMGFENVVLKTDSLLTAQALKDRKYKASYSGSFIQDWHSLSTNFSSISFGFVRRICNKVAHETAKHALSEGETKMWVGTCPSSIMQLVESEKAVTLD